MEVEFVGGAVWQYAFVPPDVHAALTGSASVGSFFATNVKPVYTSRKVDFTHPAPVSRPEAEEEAAVLELLLEAPAAIEGDGGADQAAV